MSKITLHSNFKHYSIQSQNNFFRVLKSVHGQFYRCDPLNQTEGVTYNQLTHFDQAYVVNEDEIMGACANSKCESILRTVSQFKCLNSDHCEYQNYCNDLTDCTTVAEVFYTCKPAIPSTRRYQFIHIDRDNQQCNGTIQQVSTFRGIFKCDYCVCYCDDINRNSDRLFSLQKPTSNINANEVVTGFRVVKQDRVFYLQIQVGLLLSMKKIDQSSVRWEPIAPLTVKRINEESSCYFVMKKKFFFDLDIIMLNEDEVLTGKTLNFKFHFFYLILIVILF